MILTVPSIQEFVCSNEESDDMSSVCLSLQVIDRRLHEWYSHRRHILVTIAIPKYPGIVHKLRNILLLTYRSNLVRIFRCKQWVLRLKHYHQHPGRKQEQGPSAYSQTSSCLVLVDFSHVSNCLYTFTPAPTPPFTVKSSICFAGVKKRDSDLTVPWVKTYMLTTLFFGLVTKLHHDFSVIYLSCLYLLVVSCCDDVISKISIVRHFPIR
jgi:hypothetical protein